MKTYIIVFSPEALHDIDEARCWYDLQQKDLGKRFVDDIKKIIHIIKQNPFHASVKFDDIRTASCKTFPYAVHFKIDKIKFKIRIISNLILAESLIGYEKDWLESFEECKKSPYLFIIKKYHIV